MNFDFSDGQSAAAVPRVSLENFDLYQHEDIVAVPESNDAFYWWQQTTSALSHTYLKMIRQIAVIMMYWDAAELTLALCVTDASAQGAGARDDTAMIKHRQYRKQVFRFIHGVAHATKSSNHDGALCPCSTNNARTW